MSLLQNVDIKTIHDSWLQKKKKEKKRPARTWNLSWAHYSTFSYVHNVVYTSFTVSQWYFIVFSLTKSYNKCFFFFSIKNDFNILINCMFETTK